jgi:hypothetical protein
MAAWVALYVPWRFQVEYYLLPFALGGAVLAALAVAEALRLSAGSGRALRILSVIGLVISGFLFATTIANNASNAGIQLAVDSANEEALTYVADRLPAGATLLINIQSPNEYVQEIGVSLANRGRSDVKLGIFDPEEGAATGAYILSPIVENQPFPSVRLGVFEQQARQWEKTLQQALAGQLDRRYEARATVRLLGVDALRLFCPAARAIAYCQAPHTPFDTRRFADGWMIYRVRG